MTRNYIVEKDWITTSGLRAVVVISTYAPGHRCGYVALPPDSTLHELFLYNWIDCHGGVTFLGKSTDTKYPVPSDNWWVGFDCAHGGDSPEIQNLDYCTYQCEWIASQLTQLEKLRNG